MILEFSLGFFDSRLLEIFDYLEVCYQIWEEFYFYQVCKNHTQEIKNNDPYYQVNQCSIHAIRSEYWDGLNDDVTPY